MQFDRNDYLDLMTFRRCERPMFVELFGPLVGLEEEWRAQGASEDEIDLTAFDWDYVPIARCGGNTGPIGAEPVVLEETAEHRIVRDHLGRRTMLDKHELPWDP